MLVSLVLPVMACGGPVDTLATVEGVEISLTDVTALRVTYRGNSIDTTSDQFISDLAYVIRQRLFVGTAKSQFDISFSDDDVTAWLASIPSRYVANFEAMRSNPDTTDYAIRLVAKQQMVRDAVTKVLMLREGFLKSTLRNAPEMFTRACVSHILVDTESEARAALDRIRGGEDFSALATELSTDSGSAENGGRLGVDAGCLVDLSIFVTPFAYTAAVAEVGEVWGPVETGFGFHLIRVEEREGPPLLEDLEADAIDYVHLAFGSLYEPWALDQLASVHVEVDPLVGTWSASTGSLLPPDV